MNESLLGQLLCYAADLQELMAQHTQLQQRYQMALQSQAGHRTGDDLLLSLRLHGSTLRLVTTTEGQIVRASEGAAKVLAPKGLSLDGQSIVQLAPSAHQAAVSDLLEKLEARSRSGAAELRPVVLRQFDTPGNGQAYNALVIPTRNQDHPEIYWLLSPTQDLHASHLDIQKSFVALGDSGEGIMLTDSDGNIHAVNAAFCEMTGYAESEVLGKNTRFLSSGRHSADFYQAFWDGLQQNGSWTGEMFNRRKNGQIYAEWKTVKEIKNSADQTVSYLAVCAENTNRAHEKEQLLRLAYHDALTGLPNRRLLEDRMTQAILAAHRDGTGPCVLFMDLDHFKPINDELGHNVGDVVLQEVGARLKSSVRQGDTVARVGGDEFVILLRNVSSQQDATNIGKTILRKLEAPIQAGVRHLNISASLGCARYPQDGSDMVGLLKKADSAMYAAKQSGARFCFYEMGVLCAIHE